MKTTLRRQIILLLLLALFLLLLATTLWSLYDNYSDLLTQGESLARGSAEIVKEYLDQIGLENLQDARQTERYDSFCLLMREVAAASRLDSIFAYTVDPETHVRTYVFCIAADDDRNEELQDMIGRGGKTYDPLYVQELQALAGEEDIDRIVVNNSYSYGLVWVTPYKDAEGSVLAVIGSEDSLSVGRSALIRNFIVSTVPVVLVMLVVFLLLLSFVNRWVAKPLQQISKRMNSFVADRSKSPEPLEYKFRNEIGEIADSFNKMSEDIEAYIRDIESLSREQAETNVQMDVARKIQLGMVPENAVLSGENFSAGAYAHPAKTVGGDFYDCFVRSDESVCAVIGDVSGKGVSAALFMAMAKTMIREKLKAGCSPAEALNLANDELCGENPEGLFATVQVAELNPKTGELRLANAGHTRPLLLRKDPMAVRLDTGIALGIFPDAGIREETLKLNPSEGLLLYTDGVTEAVNPDNEFYGEARLLSEAANCIRNRLTAEDSVLRIVSRNYAFRRGCPAFDDLTVLVLMLQSDDAPTAWESLPVDQSSAAVIRDRVFAEAGNTPGSRKMYLACEEVLTNIVSYSGAGQLSFACHREGEKLLVGFQDDGCAFNPLEAPEVEKNFEDLDSGGMGIKLVKQIAEKCTYDRIGNFNRFLLTFRLSSE